MTCFLKCIAARPALPTRKSTLDEETVQKLEKRLSARPDKKELVERNVLKGIYATQSIGVPVS